MRGAGVALGVTGLLLVGGCSEPEGTDPSPSASPSASPTASESPSDSPSPSPSPSETSDVPAAAREQTPEGAEAFASYYMDVLNQAMTSAEPDGPEALSADSCRFCGRALETVRQLSSDNQVYEEAPARLENLRPGGDAPQDQVFIRARLVQVGANVLDDDGEVVSTDQSGTAEVLVGVGWTDDGWRLLDVESAS
ncbi:DUF6318 family protein [Phycicoccus avicenniae]|uniref:DUF6318 family protein n=1 Tax=Phycicoccus avicenniae TaxID=2828860 RepID=UPI0034625EDD